MASQNIDPVVAASAVLHKTSSDHGRNETTRNSVKKRLQQELMTLMTSGDKGISAFPTDENIFLWVGTIQGAHGTVFEGLTYRLKLEFPSNYPYAAPNVHFTTPIFHPNIDDHGNICLDMLKEKWSALFDVRTILLSLQSLLSEPNIESPLNIVAAKMWRDQARYKKILHDRYEVDVRKKQSS